MSSQQAIPSGGHARGGPSPSRERRVRRLIAVGCTLATFGIVLSIGAASPLGSLQTVIGLILAGVGLHQWGRLGPG